MQPRALTLAQIKDGFPDKRYVGSKSLAEFCDPEVAEWLTQPRLCFLPEDQWEAEAPRARVNVASEREYEKIIAFLYELGVVRIIAEADIFRHRGRKVLAGLFGVPKSGEAHAVYSTALRLMSTLPCRSLI